MWVQLKKSAIVDGFYRWNGWTVERAGREWVITNPDRYHAGRAGSLAEARGMISDAISRRNNGR